jgi:hypothetical protein
VAKWSKSKEYSERRLPPLTTDSASAGPNWHKMKLAENPESAHWTVSWDTSRRADGFNEAHHSNKTAAIDCAKRFLRMGFIVYSIRDASGAETMDEKAINEHLKSFPQ